MDKTLSKAIFAYFGGDKKSGSFPQEVTAKWGLLEGSWLNERIEDLKIEMFQIPIDWQSADSLSAYQWVEIEMARRHPELDKSAIKQLGLYFAFETK